MSELSHDADGDEVVEQEVTWDYLHLILLLIMGISIADINAVATQFSTFYYATFDSDRAALAPLYVTFMPFSRNYRSQVTARWIDVEF